MAARPKVRASTGRLLRSKCPVAGALDIVGDRWSLLVVRDLLRGKRRYAEFMVSSEGIPTNILAERLKRLVAAGIVSKRRYNAHPPRMEYQLTTKGEDLRPILRAMLEWGVRYVKGTRRPPALPPPAPGSPVPGVKRST